MTNEEIIALAAQRGPIVSGQHDRGTEVLLSAAKALLWGLSYSISSDDPKRIQDVRCLAQHLGASIREEQESGRWRLHLRLARHLGASIRGRTVAAGTGRETDTNQASAKNTYNGQG